jgi:hypothetical protein
MGCTAPTYRGGVTTPALPETVAAVVGVEMIAAGRSRRRPATPAELATRMLPGFVVVPAVALISDVLADAVRNPDRRYVLSLPPRSGKSQLASVIAPLFALMLDPDASVVIKSYGDSLAQEHSGQARRLVGDYAGLLGFSVDQSKSAVDRWLVAGRRGGVLAGGIGSPTTGFGVSSVLIVDDAVKGAAEADSPAHRRRLVSAFRGDLLSRLHPGASCVVISTRWHPGDLSGVLLAEDGSPWTYVNVPAISTAGVPDALDREPGQAVTTALGYTAADFDRIRQEVGSRAWAAQYLGVPSIPEGSLIMAEWLDAHRLPAAPARPTRIVVAVDPADSGQGDATGIVAGSLAPDGTVSLIADASAHLTSDQWATRAAELAITLGASAVVVEGFSSATTYARLVSDALREQQPPHHISVSTWPPKGRARVGDAVSRSAGMLAALENGRCRIAGHLPDLEADMTGWQPGTHQPDRVAAALIAFDTLADAAGQRWSIGVPLGTSTVGGMAERLGSRRPVVDALVAAARQQAEAEADGTDPDETVEVQQVARVASIAGYLGRRMDARGGYDPLAHLGAAVRSRR